MSEAAPNGPWTEPVLSIRDLAVGQHFNFSQQQHRSAAFRQLGNRLFQ